MKKDKSIPVVLIGTLYLIIYIILLNIEPAFRIAYLMLSLSPILIIWMVIYILKYGTASKRTFDKYFYDDVDF